MRHERNWKQSAADGEKSASVALQTIGYNTSIDSNSHLHFMDLHT